MSFTPECTITKFGSQSKKYGIEIQTFQENEPKGESGSIFDCIANLENEFLFVHGDIIFDIDLKRFKDYHFSRKSDITIFSCLLPWIKRW